MRLVDIDKVKKHLDGSRQDWTAEDYAAACEDAEFYSSIEDFIAEHDDEIEMMMFAPELVPDEPQWIPCSERLPADNTNVLVSWNRHIKIGYLEPYEDRKYCCIPGHSVVPIDYITHWMPLPEPPESEVQYDD